MGRAVSEEGPSSGKEKRTLEEELLKLRVQRRLFSFIEHWAVRGHRSH